MNFRSLVLRALALLIEQLVVRKNFDYDRINRLVKQLNEQADAEEGK